MAHGAGTPGPLAGRPLVTADRRTAIAAARLRALHGHHGWRDPARLRPNDASAPRARMHPEAAHHTGDLYRARRTREPAGDERSPGHRARTRIFVDAGDGADAPARA